MADSKPQNIQSNKPFWLTLDNAAKIFPAIATKTVTAVIRMTAVLKEPLKLEPFRRAVLQAEKRYPYFLVRLRRGFFWYYLEHLPQHIPILADDKECSRKFSRGELLLRFLVWHNSVSLEVSHTLTDGAGAFEFFKTVLTLYSKECGATIPQDFPVKLPGDDIPKEEYEDSYKRYFKEDIPPIVKRTKAFHVPFPVELSHRFKRMNVILSMENIKKVSKEKGVSITVYLVAVYLYVLQDIFEKLKPIKRLTRQKILRVQVPINLRNILPSKTMRNFSLFVMPEIDLRLGHYSFEEILKTVYHQMQLETDEKLLNKNIARNVGSEKSIYVRSIPLFIKSLILKLKFNSLGTSQYSGVVTNLGKVKLPPETGNMVDHFILTAPPPNKLLKISCAVIGFNDKLTLSFGNITASWEFEDKFLNFLKSQNITIKAIEKDNE